MKRVYLFLSFICFSTSIYAVSPQEFEEEFAKCSPGASTVAEMGGLVAYRYEIIQSMGGRCVVESNFLKNPNPDYLNKKMKCAYDNTKPFMQAVQDMDKCSGELYMLMTGQSAPSRTSRSAHVNRSSTDNSSEKTPAVIVEYKSGAHGLSRAATYIEGQGRTGDGTFNIEYRTFGQNPTATKLKIEYEGKVIADSIYTVKEEGIVLFEDDDYKVIVGY